MHTDYILTAGSQLGGLAVLALALTVTLYLFNELYYRSFGRFRRHAILITGIAGVPVHELSHLLSATSFRFKIHEVSFYSPDPQSGTLGYVNFSYRTGVIQRFGLFITGLAPLIGGALITDYLIGVANLPRLSSFVSQFEAGPASLKLFQDWVAAFIFGLQHLDLVSVLILGLVTMIGVHSTPSKADLKGVAKGALSFVILIFVSIFVEGVLIDAGYIKSSVVLKILSGYLVCLIQLCALAAFGSVLLALSGLIFSYFLRPRLI